MRKSDLKRVSELLPTILSAEQTMLSFNGLLCLILLDTLRPTVFTFAARISNERPDVMNPPATGKPVYSTGGECLTMHGRIFVVNVAFCSTMLFLFRPQQPDKLL